MTTLSLEDALPIVDAAGEAGVPVLLRGGSGIGKSESLHTLAAARGHHLQVVVASLYSPEDFGGMPVVHDKEVTLAPMPWARAVCEDPRPSLVVFDEMNLAYQQTQAALLRVLLERVTGDTALPADTRFIAAINPTSASAGGWDLSAPVSGRFLHLDIGVNAEQWVSGMVSGWSMTPQHLLSQPVTPQMRADMLARVTAFITAQSEWLHLQPQDPALAALAWPSPRKWDWVVKVVPAVPDVDDLPVAAVEGLVGCAAADAFFTYVDELDLPDVQTVVTDPACVDWATERPDRTQAVLSALVSASDIAGAYDAAGRVLRVLVDVGLADVAAAVMPVYLKSRPAGTAVDKTLLAAFAPLLTRAGKIA